LNFPIDRRARDAKQFGELLLRVIPGVSLPLRGLSTVPDLLKQALLALQTAAHSTDARDYSELPNLLRLVDALPQETLAYLARRFEPLSGRNDAQSTSRQETLQAFLENDGSIGRAAAALHLHPNSLRKRLASIASALGTDLTTTDGITEMRLSVLANQVITARAALPQAFLADTEPA
jgi:DNA-binding PucR family transcriptional regulator